MAHAILKTVLSVLGSLLTSLMTERFLKQALVIGLEKLVKRTATDADDKLLQEARKEWGV